ncbi:efflux RND transporter periplasmic adaptor subunit, partial [Brachybacterium sp. p3-SID957]|uniref:efflux RND transporter periplasmic adaptor subunit n=1 Tax=Brachybacterium sp. p3-SID957 TaxID=2916049 RepID=UPI00223BE3A2
MTGRKRRTLVVTTVAAGMLAVGAGGFALAHAMQEEPPAASTAPVETSTAEKIDLRERVEVKGSLGYGPTRTIGTELSGTLTSVAPAGSTLKPGDELMRIDDEPVMALRGELPVWRDFEIGMSKGRDVQQLEQNLADLGYFTGEPDERFNGYTAAAIAKWQKDLGLPQDKRLERGRVVFLPEDARVQKQLAGPGSPAGDAVLEVSDTTLFATADVQPAQRDLLAKGQEVTVSLPNGEEAEGVVEEVGPAVEKEEESGESRVKVPVRVALKDPAAAESYAHVSVSVKSSRTIAEGVLTVPVRALLAQPGGGFAVDVVTGDTVTRVPVEVGRFADDMVEITGGDLSAGDQVAVGA